jgi:hypothetical protein
MLTKAADRPIKQPTPQVVTETPVTKATRSMLAQMHEQREAIFRLRREVQAALS